MEAARRDGPPSIGPLRSAELARIASLTAARGSGRRLYFQHLPATMMLQPGTGWRAASYCGDSPAEPRAFIAPATAPARPANRPAVRRGPTRKPSFDAYAQQRTGRQDATGTRPEH
jgi:hypothetical protein